MENNDVLIKKHKWFNTPDGWGQRCHFCDSYVGIGTGTDGITQCNERFNYDKFESYLEFQNFSLIDRYEHSKFPNKNLKFILKDLQILQKLKINY